MQWWNCFTKKLPREPVIWCQILQTVAKIARGQLVFSRWLGLRKSQQNASHWDTKQVRSLLRGIHLIVREAGMETNIPRKITSVLEVLPNERGALGERTVYLWGFPAGGPRCPGWRHSDDAVHRETHRGEQRRQQRCAAPGAGMRKAGSRRGPWDAHKVKCASYFLGGLMYLLETTGVMQTTSPISHRRRPASGLNPSCSVWKGTS